MEKRLKENTSHKRIVGDNLTIADFALAAFCYSAALNEQNPRHKEHLATLEKFPTLLEYARGLKDDLKEHLEKRPVCSQWVSLRYIYHLIYSIC